jgi:SpoVK/Ycf46/Vps4 family AAA+-type ATPase
MSTRRKKIKTSQNSVRDNKIIQNGGNPYAQQLLDILEENFKDILGDEINESQILYQNAKYYYSAGEYSGALVSFACASVLLNTIMRRLKVEKSKYADNNTDVLNDTITKTENVLNCCLISVEELQAIVKNNTSSGKKDDEDNKPKEWEKICVKIQPLVFKKGSSNCIFYDDVIGLESQKDQIEHSFVFPLLYPNLYPKVSKGILIYGPPGTGKTLLVKAAVNQLQERSKKDVGVLYFTPSPGDLKGKYVGETEKKIEEWFMCASQKACDQERDCNGKKFISIIFMDEIDSIARDRSQDSSGLAANSVNTLLQMMDGINSKENVAIIGATNYPWDLDSAILRRFDTQILIGLPEREDKKKLLDYEVNRYLDIKLKISTVCDKPKIADVSEQLNNDNAEKCGIQCERVKESPHINDPFIKKFSIDYYTDLEKESDSTKLSRVGGIINILEEKNFTNSDISRFVKTAARRAGELSIKCNIFYNTSIVNDTREKGEDRYMSSLTRIKDETQAITSSIEILESFKQSKEHNKIYQIEPPKISIIQYNGHNYYNMKCILYKNSDMIMDFPLLQNMFIKGEKIDSKNKISPEEYKKQILNQGASDATDIIMSFNVNFEEKIATTGQGGTTPTGVLMFPSQLVNSVYSSVIGVYFGDPKNSQKKNDSNRIPTFFDKSNYTYKDDTGAVETQINSNLNKIILNKCNFDFFSFLLLSKISEHTLINNTATYCDGLIRELGIGKIEKALDLENINLNEDALTSLTLVNDAKIELKEDVKIKSGEISFFYPKGTGTDIFIKYKYYKLLINYFDVYSSLFLNIIADINDDQYFKIPINLFCLLFYEELNGEIPLYTKKHVLNSEILLIQLYLNSALRLVINYEKNDNYSVFSKCMLVNFLGYFTEAKQVDDAYIKKTKKLIDKANNMIDKAEKKAADEANPDTKAEIEKNMIDEAKKAAETMIAEAAEKANNIIDEAAEKANNIIDEAAEKAANEINPNTKAEIEKNMIEEAEKAAETMIDEAEKAATEVIKKIPNQNISNFANAENISVNVYIKNIQTEGIKQVKNNQEAAAVANDINTKAEKTKKIIDDAKKSANDIINFPSHILTYQPKPTTDWMSSLLTGLGQIVAPTGGAAQNGGALDNDIMTYIFRVILQEKYICDNWYLFFDTNNSFMDDKPYSAKDFNTKFDGVYTNGKPNQKLVDFYNEQQALINNTNVGDIHTKEIFLATKFNFNAIYELNRPNVISTVGTSFSKAWTTFKNFLALQAQLSAADQKSADNATLMNELVENNQLISVLFKEITAYGFLFDNVGKSDGFKVKSDNGADSEKFINVLWKNVEFGKLVKMLDIMKDQLISTSPELITGALLGYGAYSIGGVISYMAAGGIGIGLATVGLAPVLAVGGLVAGGLTLGGVIGTGAGTGAGTTIAGTTIAGATATATATATTAETAAVAAALATGYGAGALAAGAFGSWIVISNLYKFLYRKDITSEYIINNIFITTLLNIITTVGKFTIDFNKNLLDEVQISINKIVNQTVGGIFWKCVTLNYISPTAWSTSNTGFMLDDLSSTIIGNKNQENLTITRFKKTGITKKDINYSLFNINIPFQAFYYALIHVKSSYNDQLGKDLIDYNTNRDKFLAEKEKRDKERKK